MERLQEEQIRSERMKNADEIQQQMKELKMKDEEAAMLRCEEARLIEHEKLILEAVSFHGYFHYMKKISEIDEIYCFSEKYGSGQYLVCFFRRRKEDYKKSREKDTNMGE